jgi:hypothetical protein
MKIETILTPAELPALAQRDLRGAVPCFNLFEHDITTHNLQSS